MLTRLSGTPRIVAGLATCAVLLVGCGSTKQAANVSAAPPPNPTTDAAPPSTAPETTAPTSTTAPSAATLVAEAVQDARAKGWVHIVALTTLPSGHTVLSTQDAGTSSGHQVIVADGAHAEVIVVAGMAYIRGDANAIPNYFGFPASQTARLANRWISFPPTSSGFSTVAYGVTINSALQESTVTAPLSLGGHASISGVSVIQVTGAINDPTLSQTVTGTLSVTAGPDPLPVQLVGTSPDGTRSTVTFGPWGTAATLSAPSNPIPASSIPA